MLQSGPCLLTWYDPALGGINGGGQYADGGTYQGSDMACAAPPAYPFGTNIQFFANGRSVICRVRDRGGAIQGTHFDLTTGASSKLTGGPPNTLTGTFKVVSQGTDNSSHSGIPLIGGAIDAFNNATGYPQARGAAVAATGGIKDIAGAIGWVFSATGADRILKVVGGGVLLLLAANELIKSAGGTK